MQVFPIRKKLTLCALQLLLAFAGCSAAYAATLDGWWEHTSSASLLSIEFILILSCWRTSSSASFPSSEIDFVRLVAYYLTVSILRSTSNCKVRVSERLPRWGRAPTCAVDYAHSFFRAGITMFQIMRSKLTNFS